MQQVHYGGFVLRPCERPINWPTLPALIVALLEAQARIWKEASAWAR